MLSEYISRGVGPLGPAAMSLHKVAMYAGHHHVDNTALVEQYAPMVKRIALHLLSRLPPNVQLNDLIQSGMVGLLEVAKKYDSARGASFETYAGIRIRGAMLDDIRKDDWAPRSVHRNARRVAVAIKTVEGRTGRDAIDAEVAKELGVPLDDYYTYLRDSAGTRLFSYDDLLENQGEGVLGEADTDTEISEPLDEVQKQAFSRNLAGAISDLPEREKLVLALYYKEELNLKEIGLVLGVSESRVSQIHSQAALRLRARLSIWREKEK